MSNREVEIMNATPGEKGPRLSELYDQSSGQYFVPPVPSLEDMPRKEVSFLSFLRDEVNKRRIAILDTGLMLSHPWLKDCVVESVDYTGEGPEDLNGHGTVCALLELANHYPWETFGKPRIINVKVLNFEGRGTPENLIKGIRWLIGKEIDVANISGGGYMKKWFRDCEGDCELCKAAEEAARHGTIIAAAAGNKAGVTSCPSKIGLVKPRSGVISVGGLDFKDSGNGTIYAPAHTQLVPIRPTDRSIATGGVERKRKMDRNAPQRKMKQSLTHGGTAIPVSRPTVTSRPIPNEIKRKLKRMDAQPVTTILRVFNRGSMNANVTVKYHSIPTGNVIHTGTFIVLPGSSQTIRPDCPAGQFSVDLSADQPIEAIPLFDLFLLPDPFCPQESETIFFKVHSQQTPAKFTVRRSYVDLKRNANDDTETLCSVPHEALYDRLIIKKDILMALVKKYRLRSPAFLHVHFELDMQMPDPELDKRAESLGTKKSKLMLKAKTLNKFIQVLW